MKVAIGDIVPGRRRREEFGDLDALAKSIRKYGLIQPVVVDDRDNLVAGERRLRACQMLGWTEVEVRRYGELSDDERQEIEREENTQRKSLTEYELSKKIVKQAEKVAPSISSRREEKDSRGRKSKYQAPKADIAHALGRSVGSLVQAEQHVAAAEKYPELKAAGIPQKTAIEIADRLDRAPEQEREATLEALRLEDMPLPPATRPPEDRAYSAIGKLGAFAHLDPALVAVTPAASEALLAPPIFRSIARWIESVADALDDRNSGPSLKLVGE